MQSKIGCYIIAVAVITVWSTTFVSTKILLHSLSPEEIMFYRHVLAYLVLLAAYPHRHPSGGFREELLFAGAGIFGSTLYFLTENYALKYSMASNVGLLLATTPMLTAIVARFLTTGEPFNRQLAAGFCIAFLGVFLVIFNGHFILKLHPIGDLPHASHYDARFMAAPRRTPHAHRHRRRPRHPGRGLRIHESRP